MVEGHDASADHRQRQAAGDPDPGAPLRRHREDGLRPARLTAARRQVHHHALGQRDRHGLDGDGERHRPGLPRRGQGALEKERFGSSPQR